MTFLKEGCEAPGFELKNQHQELINLSDFRNEKYVVLYFYPKASTPGCTVQACSIRDSYKEFSELDTVVLGISPDPSYKLLKFEQKQNLNFSLLSDLEHVIAEKYGVWDLKKFMGREFFGIIRSTFIIDKTGLIAHIMPKVNTKTHHDDTLLWLRNNIK